MRTAGIVCISITLLVLGACGGGGGSGGSGDDFITLTMSPLRVIGFGDDGNSDPLHPIVDMGIIADGETVLLRVRDPYARGDFYSIKVRNGYGEVSNGAPAPADGEPNNSPAEATVLTFGDYAHNGLDPLMDEDWFSFTGSAGECCHFASTISNLSGTTADPVLEVYDPMLNPGAVTYRLLDSPTDRITVNGVYDPVNNATLIGMTRVNPFDGLDKNAFFLIFSGPPTAGNFPIDFAAPPIPGDAPGSVTGTVRIDRYDQAGGDIEGSFSLTIVDISRTTTISGSFDVERRADEAGLLSRPGPDAARIGATRSLARLKELAGYMNRISD